MTAPQLNRRPGIAAGAPDLTGGATRLAERAVLAAVLYQPDRMADLDRWLRADDFADPHHADIYRTIAGLRTAGDLRPITTIGSSPVEPATRSAIVDNVLAVQTALHAGRFTSTPQLHAGVHDLLSAAPINDTRLPVRYGRMVLESSARRRVQSWAVRFDPTSADAPVAQREDLTRDLSVAHHALLVDLADLQRRTAQSTMSPDLAALAGVYDAAASISAGPMAVPASPPAQKLVERAERDVVAAVLTDETGQHTHVRDHLEPDDFTASPRHAATWRAIQAVARRGEPVNAITVAWEAEHLPTTDHSPPVSADELAALADTHAPSTLRRQTTIIARASIYHRVHHAAGQLAYAARDRSRAVDELLTTARDAASELHDHANRLADETTPAAGTSTIRQRLEDLPAAPARQP